MSLLPILFVAFFVQDPIQPQPERELVYGAGCKITVIAKPGLEIHIPLDEKGQEERDRTRVSGGKLEFRVKKDSCGKVIVIPKPKEPPR